MKHRLTNLEFAQRTAGIAYLASDWTRSILDDAPDAPARAESVLRFAAELRSRLAHMEKLLATKDTNHDR